MLMQILHVAGLDCAFDKARKPDESNPKGYFELGGGKVINKLIDGSFPIDDYKGRIIKITAYGLKFLPPGKYNIIYSERNIKEILDSMEKMAEIKDENRNKTKKAFIDLNEMIKTQIKQRKDISVLFVDYNQILAKPAKNIKKIQDYFKISEEKFDDMINVIDKELYRNRIK